jgi:5-methylcytosine-specific restriction protein B
VPIDQYLEQQYRLYLERLPSEEWLQGYEQFCKETRGLASYINGDSRQAFENACAQAKINFGDYVEEVWYHRNNRVASMPQGGISRKTFENLLNNEVFWNVFCRTTCLAHRDHDKELICRSYDEMIQWMDEFRIEQQVNRFPALVNRFFSGCLPGHVTTIVAEAKCDELLSAIEASDLAEFQDTTRISQNLSLLRSLNRGVGEPRPQDDTPFRRSIFFWWLYENGSGAQERQIIFFGSPGTGKTWEARRIADLHINAWRQRHMNIQEGDKAIVQFHPSYAYEDFIEGIRPVGIEQGQIQLELTDGVFKRFCRKAAKWEIDYFRRTGQPITRRTTIADLPPYIGDQDLWSFVNGLDNTENIIDHLPPYCFIVDEINRAELSRVLGEIMYSLEYRGFDQKNRIQTQYSSLVKSIDAKGAFLFIGNENYFFIPHNVFLIGTMNVIDRSVEAFDFALRRRFRWIELISMRLRYVKF